jgi:hypothetical protein
MVGSTSIDIVAAKLSTGRVVTRRWTDYSRICEGLDSYMYVTIYPNFQLRNKYPAESVYSRLPREPRRGINGLKNVVERFGP